MHLGEVLAGLETGRSDEGLAFEVPDEWRQGRTLYGGLNAALCVSAAQLAGAPVGELRALLMGPVPSPPDCPPLPVAKGLPAFLSEMEVRFASGSLPFSAGDPAFAMWVRHRDAAGVAPATALVAVADTLPPAALAQVDRSTPHPASSITWTIDLAPPAPDPAGWYLLETRSEQTADGYSLQVMRCFTPDGRLAAAGRQTVAIF